MLYVKRGNCKNFQQAAGTYLVMCSATKDHKNKYNLTIQ